MTDTPSPLVVTRPARMVSSSRWTLAVLALDLRALAIFRIGLGFAILLDVIARAADLVPLYTDAGVLPRTAWFRDFPSSWSLHAATGSAVGEAVLFAVGAACACSVVVGYRTRTAALLSWVLALSLQQRNPLLFSGFDLVERSLLLWSLFLPLGGRFSVDAARTAGAEDAGVVTSVLSAGTVAFVAQLVLMYVLTALHLLAEPTWRDGSALFLALETEAQATPLGHFIASHHDVVRALCPIVIAFELTAPCLLLLPFRRARVVGIAAFTLFHVASALLLALGLLPLLAVIALVPLVPWTVEKRAAVQPPRAVRVAADTRALPALLAGAILAVVVIINVEDVAGARWLSVRAHRVVAAVGLDAPWNVLVRPALDGWLVAPAVLKDGRVVDALTGAAVSFDKPDPSSSSSPAAASFRWRKLRAGLERNLGKKLRAPYARWLCAQAHASSLELWFVREVERVDGAASSTSREKLAQVTCGG